MLYNIFINQPMNKIYTPAIKLSFVRTKKINKYHRTRPRVLTVDYTEECIHKFILKQNKCIKVNNTYYAGQKT